MKLLVLALFLFQACSAISIPSCATLQTLPATGTHTLTANFTCSAAFTPLASFSGILDGNGYTITNFVGALFTTFSGTVRDLNFVNPSRIAAATNTIGLISGTMTAGLITNVHAKGGSVSGFNTAGGLVAFQSGGSITYSSFEGTVSCNSICGGLVGTLTGATIADSWAKVIVSSGSTTAGGLVGSAGEAAAINRCWTTGSVSATTQYAGGLVGVAPGPQTTVMSILRSFSAANITSPTRSAGVIGQMDVGTISNCYATGSVRCDSTGICGGFVGRQDGGSIATSYSVGRVDAPTPIGYDAGQSSADFLKGFFGAQATSTRSNCFFDSDTSTDTFDVSGSGVFKKTTVQMQTASTFSTWNAAVWYFPTGSYPRLRSGTTAAGGHTMATILNSMPFLVVKKFAVDNVPIGSELTLTRTECTRPSIAGFVAGCQFTLGLEDYTAVPFTPTFDGSVNCIQITADLTNFMLSPASSISLRQFVGGVWTNPTTTCTAPVGANPSLAGAELTTFVESTGLFVFAQAQTPSFTRSRTRTRTKSRSQTKSKTQTHTLTGPYTPSRTRTATRTVPPPQTSTRSRTAPPPSESTVNGDPHFVGLMGQKFLIEGVPDQTYSLISTPSFQMNMGLGSITGAHSMTVLLDIGLIIGNDDVYISRLAHLRINSEKAGNVTVLSDGVSTVTRDVNKDGSGILVQTPEFTLRFVPRNYELDVKEIRMNRVGDNDIHGIIGQTWDAAKWPAYSFDKEIKSEDILFAGLLEGSHISDYEVDGLFGTTTKFGRFDVEKFPATHALTRRARR